MKTELINRTNQEIPRLVADALGRFNGKWTGEIESVHHIIDECEFWIVVAGVGAMGSYEWFVIPKDPMKPTENSNRGYGQSTAALRDGLSAYLDS